MNTRKGRFGLFAAWVLACLACSPAGAQEILIGHVAGYTGPVSKTANEIALGARVAIEAINARGGVLGRTLRLVTADDQFKPEDTARLIAGMSGKISALLPTLGSANMTYVLKQGTLDRVTFPVLGAIPSQESFRQPLHRNVFHFRAGDRDQLEKIVVQLTTVGTTKIAVMAPNNPNGKEGSAIVEEALRQHNLKLAAQGLYEISLKADFEPQIKAMQNGRPDAIIFLGPSNLIAEITKKLRSRGVESALYSASYADHKTIMNVVGPQLARGFVIAQVVPNVNKRTLRLVKAFHGDYEKYRGVTEFGKTAEAVHLSLEGYIAVKLIEEAIRRSKDASPGGVRRGLELLREFDLGGFIVDFGPRNHIGSRWVDLAIIDAQGQLIH